MESADIDREEEEARDLPDVHLDEAYALREKGNLAAALAECDSAIDLGLALVAEAYNLRGIVLEELERVDEALDAYRRALDVYPQFQDAAENLSGLEAELGVSHTPVVVGVFGSVEEAYIARGQLEIEGVESFVADEHFSTTFGPIASRGVRLLVRESDVGRAAEILGLEPDEGGED